MSKNPEKSVARNEKPEEKGQTGDVRRGKYEPAFLIINQEDKKYYQPKSVRFEKIVRKLA